MIVVSLSGGLGNQMFQYACALSVANENNKELYVDLQSFQQQNKYTTSRKFELDIFDLDLKTADKKILGYFYAPSNVLARQLWKVQRKLLPSIIISETFFQYKKIDVGYYNLVLLKGYWQSYKYFLSLSEDNQRIFKFKKDPNSHNKELINSICREQSVAVHIRRGDYKYDKRTNQFHGLCSPFYYEKAIEYMRKYLDNPIFYFFSDDPDWVKFTYKHIDNSFVIDHNKGSNSWEDLRLMSACKHNIIANSTFSWWGAWLNQSPTKIVIAPIKWFSNGDSALDLIPDNWVRL